jgi:hypothetical protein
MSSPFSLDWLTLFWAVVKAAMLFAYSCGLEGAGFIFYFYFNIFAV